MARLTLERKGPKTSLQLGDHLTWTHRSNTLQITRQGKRIFVDNGLPDDRTLLAPMNQEQFTALAGLIAATQGLDIKLIRDDDLTAYELVE